MVIEHEHVGLWLLGIGAVEWPTVLDGEPIVPDHVGAVEQLQLVQVYHERVHVHPTGCVLVYHEGAVVYKHSICFVVFRPYHFPQYLYVLCLADLMRLQFPIYLLFGKLCIAILLYQSSILLLFLLSVRHHYEVLSILTFNLFYGTLY